MYTRKTTMPCYYVAGERSRFRFENNHLIRNIPNSYKMILKAMHFYLRSLNFKLPLNRRTKREARQKR